MHVPAALTLNSLIGSERERQLVEADEEFSVGRAWRDEGSVVKTNRARAWRLRVRDVSCYLFESRRMLCDFLALDRRTESGSQNDSDNAGII